MCLQHVNLMYSCTGFIKISYCMQKLKTVKLNLLILHFNVLISFKSASVCKNRICQPIDSVFQHVYFT